MKDILLQQSFHGYSEGHRLLESSIKLPDEAARLMLRMSDLSGGSIFPGFEEYLTGYAVASLNLYVFAKTWYAPEMPRPGCVWTHSLILQAKDLAGIPSLTQLTKLFIRPKTTSSKSPRLTGAYTNSIRFDPQSPEDEGASTDTNLMSQINALVNALYLKKKRNLLVVASSSTNFERSILRIWSQQWPSLRNSFSFCTGSLSARGFAGKPFDVQCAPSQLIREITTSALAKQSQEMNLMSREEIFPAQDWTYATVQDAALVNGGAFREGLWTLADGASLDDFEGFAIVVSEFLSQKALTLQIVISLVADRFPDKTNGTKLKKQLFGPNRPKMEKPNFSELEILAELSMTDKGQAFDSEALNLRFRANQLCENFPEDAKELISKLFRGNMNSLGEDVLAGLLEAINPELAKRITAQQPHFLPTLFRAKPELGTSADLWRAAGDHVRELFESLSSTDSLSEDCIAKIVEAILAGGAEIIIKRALDRWKKAAVFGVLNHVANSEELLSERVMGALTFHIESIVEWLRAEGQRPLFARIICAHIIGPYSYQVVTYGTQVWLRTYEELRTQAKRSEVNYLATLLLALGLQNAAPMPVKLIGLCFGHIHQLAWDEQLPDTNWVILDPIVPHLSWIHDWDKCERLRRGLIESFVKFQWPIEQIQQCVKSDDLLVRVLQSAKKVEGGSELFSKFK